MLLDVRDLKKSFPGPVPVLRGVSLSLDAGEVVALTGESGSGKSTLLHIIGGLEPADSGDLTFENRDVTAMKNLEADTTMRGHACDSPGARSSTTGTSCCVRRRRREGARSSRCLEEGEVQAMADAVQPTTDVCDWDGH